jgi:spore germination protein (amino acid permease)
MLMENKTLSSQQIAFMIFLFLTGSSLVYIPEIAARQSAWIACLLASLIGVYIIIILLALFTRFPDMSITRISELLLGKIAGSVLNILLFFSLFLIAQGLLYNLCLLLGIIYPTVCSFIHRSLVLFSAAYCIYRGPAALGRLCESFIGLILFFFLLGITASFPIMDLSELKPLWPEWKPLLSGVFFVADWPFAQLLILAFFFPLVQGLKEKKKAFIGWYLLAVAILIFEDLQVISILGQELAEISRFPLLKVNRLTGFGEFRRVELFFFILWFIVGFTALTVYYQGLVLNLKELLRLENPRPLILPLGLFLMVFTSYMYPSDLNYITTRLRYVPFYTISVNLLYLTIIFIAASLSKRRLSRHSRGEG